MFWYMVKRIGTGTEDNPYRPDLPDGTSWLGQRKGANYIIVTSTEILDGNGRERVMPAQIENALRGFDITREEVLQRWQLHGESMHFTDEA